MNGSEKSLYGDLDGIQPLVAGLDIHLEDASDWYPPPKTSMTMEAHKIEDVFHIEHGDFPMSC